MLADIRARFYGSTKSLVQLAELSALCREIPGDFVECGIAMGSGIACMKRACPNKLVWGYDSFQGIQLAGPKDSEQPGIGGPITHDTSGNLLVSSGITVHSREQVNDILFNQLEFKEDDFILVEGWIQETLPKFKPKKIALLRLDMDLYDPTLFALEQLYPRLSKGGVLLIDDYGSCSGVAKACFDYFGTVGWNCITGENPAYLIK